MKFKEVIEKAGGSPTIEHHGVALIAYANIMEQILAGTSKKKMIEELLQHVGSRLVEFSEVSDDPTEKDDDLLVNLETLTKKFPNAAAMVILRVLDSPDLPQEGKTNAPGA